VTRVPGRPPRRRRGDALEEVEERVETYAVVIVGAEDGIDVDRLREVVTPRDTGRDDLVGRHGIEGGIPADRADLLAGVRIRDRDRLRIRPRIFEDRVVERVAVVRHANADPLAGVISADAERDIRGERVRDPRYDDLVLLAVERDIRAAFGRGRRDPDAIAGEEERELGGPGDREEDPREIPIDADVGERLGR